MGCGQHLKGGCAGALKIWRQDRPASLWLHLRLPRHALIVIRKLPCRQTGKSWLCQPCCWQPSGMLRLGSHCHLMRRSRSACCSCTVKLPHMQKSQTEIRQLRAPDLLACKARGLADTSRLCRRLRRWSRRLQASPSQSLPPPCPAESAARLRGRPTHAPPALNSSGLRLSAARLAHPASGAGFGRHGKHSSGLL